MRKSMILNDISMGFFIILYLISYMKCNAENVLKYTEYYEKCFTFVFNDLIDYFLQVLKAEMMMIMWSWCLY